MFTYHCCHLYSKRRKGEERKKKKVISIGVKLLNQIDFLYHSHKGDSIIFPLIIIHEQKETRYNINVYKYIKEERVEGGIKG
jgi:hypothetical protein